MYAVTGGTGFLGEHLVRLLVEDGQKVRVLARSATAEDVPPGVEVVAGSVLDDAAVAAAVRGATGVFHLAGLVEHGRRPARAAAMLDVNVGGTVRVVRAAAAAGATRVVYASTSGAVAVSRDSSFMGGEDSAYAREVTAGWPYYRTKIAAEEGARAAAARDGVQLVCMRPTLLLGPGDRRLSSCRSVLDLLRRKVPFVPPGGFSMVDVRDVAAAFLAAMKRGRPGEAYLLGAKNMTVAEYFARVEKLSGVAAPRLRVPAPLATALASAATSALGAFGAWDPSLDPVVVEMSQHFWYLDASKATRELGFQPRDPDVTLRDTISWLRAHMAEL